MSKKRKSSNRKRRPLEIREQSAAQPPSPPALLLIADPHESSSTLTIEPLVPRQVKPLCPGPDNSLANVEVPSELLRLYATPREQQPGDTTAAPGVCLPWPPPSRRATVRWAAVTILSAAVLLLMMGGVRAAGDYRAKRSAMDGSHAVAAKTASEVTGPLLQGAVESSSARSR